MPKDICDIRPTLIPTHHHVLPRSPIPSSQRKNQKDPHQKDPQNYRERSSLLNSLHECYIYIYRMKKRDLYSKSQTYILHGNKSAERDWLPPHLLPIYQTLQKTITQNNNTWPQQSSKSKELIFVTAKIFKDSNSKCVNLLGTKILVAIFLTFWQVTLHKVIKRVWKKMISQKELSFYLLSVRPAALPYIYFRVFSLEPSYQYRTWGFFHFSREHTRNLV